MAMTQADVAFWYTPQTKRPSAILGSSHLRPDQYASFANKLLEALPPDQMLARWTNPNPDALPTAALFIRKAKFQGVVFALSMQPGKRFEESDLRSARMAVKMFASHRAYTQTMTKQLLLGLLHSLTAVIDAKDPYTAGHSERVARIAVLLAQAMGLSEATQGDVFLAGLLHDLGKIGVPDAILTKPGKLTADEFTEIRAHPVIGERIVASIKPFERLCPAVRNHHERYDGTGYPDGLAGEGIPLIARILAVADALDAMMSPRRYRAARSPLEIDAIFIGESGRQFDPAIVKAFMTIRQDVYPPIYQKGIGDSAMVALDHMVSGLTDASMTRLPMILPDDPGSGR